MKQTLRILPFVVLACGLLLTAAPAAAQTAYKTRAEHKREVRQSIKAARQIKTDYSESHLDVSAYNFRGGESGRKQKKVRKKEQMLINEDGTAVIKPRVFPKKNVQARVARGRGI
ncbi:hypothetical protein [Rufibacter psychrotolerans]|uniref:hypothetical protein n=1 Tax=Rufibacter psychrotolerans TaxID=2812556 RepID=UPI0019677058|nr:hypothetical protein [Rufibacter sp. SYSU D00308]